MTKCRKHDPFAPPRDFHPLHSFPPVSISSDFSQTTVDAIIEDAERACLEASEDGADLLHDQFDAGSRILTGLE